VTSTSQNLDWGSLFPDPDEALFDVEAAPRLAARAQLTELLPILICPDTRSFLHLQEGVLANAEGARFPFDAGRPVLLPRAVLERTYNSVLPLTQATLRTALDQYLYLALIKSVQGEPNTPSSDGWYRRHLHRSQVLVQGASGLVLDIGCDDPALSSRLFPRTVTYLGIEPSLAVPGEFRIVGMAEFLPFADCSFDGVAFLTSLDHILDYHRAIGEAVRVLKPGGLMFLATLVWTHGAELYWDSIHFHHFREYELKGVLSSLHVEGVRRYGWKGEDHRYGVYLTARKPR